MAELLSAQDWLDYENSIIEALSSTGFAQKTMTWNKSKIKGTNRFGEDTTETKQEIILNCICNYNYLRSWPITDYTPSGATDKQSVQVIISQRELESRSLIDSNGNMDYNPEYDSFILDGLLWKGSGDTAAAQSANINLMFTLILTRQLKPTRSQ